MLRARRALLLYLAFDGFLAHARANPTSQASSVTFTISGGAATRSGGPQKPVPRLT